VVAGGGTVVEIDGLVPSTVILVDHALVRTFYKGAIGLLVISGSENPELFNVPGTEPPPTGGGDDGASAGNGEVLFAQSCVACHGQDAEGIDGLGPALTENEFVAGLTDDDLVEFLKVGRPVDHPDNTTGVAMPPKGGNPALSDDDLGDIVAFLREIG
jgi:disulfide bond formation protein DsbB